MKLLRASRPPLEAEEKARSQALARVGGWSRKPRPIQPTQTYQSSISEVTSRDEADNSQGYKAVGGADSSLRKVGNHLHKDYNHHHKDYGKDDNNSLLIIS